MWDSGATFLRSKTIIPDFWSHPVIKSNFRIIRKLNLRLYSPNNLDTAPCWVSMCCARSYPLSPKRDSSSSLCCDTNAPIAWALGIPGPPKMFVADWSWFGDPGRLGDIPTEIEEEKMVSCKSSNTQLLWFKSINIIASNRENSKSQTKESGKVAENWLRARNFSFLLFA